MTLLLASAAAAPTRAAQAHVLRWTDGMDVATLNPLLATSANIGWLSQLTMAHFTRFDERGAVVPELISQIPSSRNGGISPDGKSITYHLRHGVRWSDGAGFDASDVVYTVGAIQNRANNISQRDAWDRVVEVHATDPYTVVFRLKAPYASFASSFFGSFSTSCVLPKHLLASSPTLNEAAYNALPVGIGPFRYTAFKRSEAIEMEANPFYFGGRPKLAKIVYKIITDDNTIYTQLQTHELDLWAAPGGDFFERLQNIKDVRVVTTHSPYVSAIYLNTRSQVVGERDVRRALRLATDRVFLLHSVYHRLGTLAESVVPQVSMDFDATLPQTPYDPSAAERLLDAAGWKRGADGIRAKAGVPLFVNITLPSGYGPSASTAEILRAGWNHIGVGVNVKAYASGTFFGLASMGGIISTGKFDAALLSLPGGVLADESAYYGCAYAPPNGFNETRYCNRSVDAAMDAYLQTYDPNQRAVFARRFQRRIDDDAPAIITYERDFAYAFDESLTNFQPNAFGPFDNFLTVDIGP